MPIPIDISQQQLRDLSAYFSKYHHVSSPALTEKERNFLQTKTQEFLQDRQKIIVTNRHHRQSDGYFLLEISQKGIRLMTSKSVLRQVYTYAFSSNEFRLNDHVIDPSKVGQFIHFFNHIVARLSTHEFEILEVVL